MWGSGCAAELYLEIKDEHHDNRHENENDGSQNIRSALEAPRQLYEERDKSQGCGGDHEVDEAFDAYRSQHAPDRDSLGVREQVAAQEFARPKRQDQVGEEAGENGADRVPGVHFPERAQQELPAQGLDGVAQDVEGHADENPFPVRVGHIVQGPHDVEVVQNPDQADGRQSVTEDEQDSRSLGLLAMGLRGQLSCSGSSRHFG